VCYLHLSLNIPLKIFYLNVVEFFHTERSHVRNLKVLDRVFFRPLKETKVMESELIDRLFPNLEEVLSVHVSFSQKMREKIKAGYPIGSIAHLLSEMVSIQSHMNIRSRDPHLLISVRGQPWRLFDSGWIGIYQKPKVFH